MEIDVAMFSDWDFYHTGAFAYFTSESTNSVDSGIYNIKTNENINLTMRGTATNAANDGSSTFVGEKMPGEDVVYCKQSQAVADYNNDNWKRFGTTDDKVRLIYRLISREPTMCHLHPFMKIIICHQEMPVWHRLLQ